MNNPKVFSWFIKHGYRTAGLYKFVLVYLQQNDAFHVTRPNLCSFKDALGMIFQSTACSHTTAIDHRHVYVSTGQRCTWQLDIKITDINNYTLMSTNNGTSPGESRKIF